MYTKFISDPNTYSLFLKFDEDLALKCWTQPCSHCGGKLNQAHYLRKPRGGPLAPEAAKRFSFCCRESDCRRRQLAPSIRFLGRRVYLSVFVTLITAMSQGITASRAARLYKEIGVSRKTLQRWRRWWRGHVPATVFWKESRGRFINPIDPSSLPNSLVDFFAAIDSDVEIMVIKVLKFIIPLGQRDLGN